MQRLRDLSEAELLRRLEPVYAVAAAGVRARVPLGTGDDAAVVAAPGGSVVATVDTMVRGLDWRDDWSSAEEVGAKIAVQNIADIAAMGAVPTALLVSLAADPETSVEWAVGLARGIASVAEATGIAVVGGDLSGAGAGVVVVSVTALGDLEGREPVVRSGARPGDVVAVCGSLGRSGAGLALHYAGDDASSRTTSGDQAGVGGVSGGPVDPEVARALMAEHRTPRCPWEGGPVAARAGAHALIDVSDGLVTDLGRIAASSGVAIDLDESVLRERYAAGDLTAALGPEQALAQVLSGGEEHSLVGCFAAEVDLTLLEGEPWRAIGSVYAATGGSADATGASPGPGAPAPAVGVTVEGVVREVCGWDHFGG